MSAFRQLWHKLIQRIRPRVPWSADEVQRELLVARQERQQLLNQLTDLQVDVERGVSAGQQEQQKLLAQLQALQVTVEQERADAGLEKQVLRGELTGLRSEVERGLEAARQDQQGVFGRLNGLRAEVEHSQAAMREEQQGLLGQLDGLRSEVDHGLEALRQDQQGVLGRLSGLQTEIEHTVAAVREETQGLGSRLDGLRSEVDHGLQAAHQEQQELHGRVDGLQAGIEQNLGAIRHAQQGLQERLNGLQTEVEREFSAVREDRQALVGRLDNLQGELEHARGREHALRAELEQRFEQVRIDRDATDQEIAALRTSLAESDARREATDTRVDALEIRLEEQQQEHDVALQKSFIRERRLARRLTAAMTVAGAAFVLGIVAGGINFWEARNTSRLLANVSQGIRDIKATIATLPSSGLRAPLPGKEPSAPNDHGVPDVSRLPPPDAASAAAEKKDSAEGTTAQELPPPDFIASRSLPRGDYNFERRQDARAFFEDNAKLPGVVSLEDGLQYRELIPGTGATPRTSDQVVVEYRAFRPDGTETDNSFKASLPTTLTVSDAIPALKEALLRMREGAQWELYIPPNLAYPGTRKRGPHGYEPLILTVELISVKAAPAGQP